MKLRSLAVALLCALALPAVAKDDFAEVRAVLNAQARAWNRGDILGYMNGYARGDNTTFVGSDGVTRGWQTVFDRYKAKYDTRAKMGTLAFSDLDLRSFGDEILVTGAWALTRESDNPHGRFTLIFNRTSAGWRIVYDHSS
ncbi:MAG: nuclear transport factor 2 family protein [Acidobacteriota bacterium]